MNNKIFIKTLILFLLGLSFSCQYIKNQTSTTAKKEVVTEKKEVVTTNEKPVWVAKKFNYNESRELKVDLIHTKLEVNFNWELQQMNGIATLKFQPYFYPQNSLILDAKGFDIKSIEIISKEKSTILNYTYDKLKINISLDRTYQKNEIFELKIVYTAKPNELPKGGSIAITDDKGLYFINADGKDPEKPKQIWTQGETEASSCWFPTIDSPNEKHTQEIYITTDKKYLTLSNGVLVYSTQNEDGSRTDYWKQELPHSPYLTMMAIGDFAVIKDKWKTIEVDYLVEHKYAPYAKAIFGHTPEMLEFFSNKLNYKFPWDKYSQIVVRDYVSGAMENTSATIMMDALQIDNRELLDQNWDYIIAHELFHHWFGDLVTAESWSNLPLNESFANYSEYLWEEYKYGKDFADFHAQEEAEQYFGESMSKQEPLIRYCYHDREDMFDAHSYNKGGLTLHMLRNVVGDDAFFASLSLYLTKNEFKAAEIHDLRLAFEEVTGQDLNWFFNQYFMSPGHAELEVKHSWADGKLKLNVVQKQDSLYTPIYKIPVKIDIWVNGIKERHDITITKAIESFEFETSSKPNLVLFDGEQQLLALIEHEKTESELIFQYLNSDKYLARHDALVSLSPKFKDSVAVKNVFKTALNDQFWKIKDVALEQFDAYKGTDSTEVMNKLIEISNTDSKRAVRAKALEVLASNGADKYKELFLKGMNDSAYSVVASSLVGYSMTKSADRLSKLAQFENIDNKEILNALAEVYAEEGDTSKYIWFTSKVNKLSGMELYYFITDFSSYLTKMDISIQKKAKELFEPMARKNDTWYIKFGAFKALANLRKIPEIKDLLNDINSKETDEKVKKYYARVLNKK